MLSDQCQKDLNQIMNHLKMLGTSLNAARRVFEKAGDTGVAMMLRNEAMERWSIGGMIGDYIVAEGGSVIYEEVPKPAIEAPGPTYLQNLLPKDEMTVTTLDAMINAAMQRGSYKTGNFMFKIAQCCQKEYHELKGRVADIVRIANSPEFPLYDAYLQEEYAEYKGEYEYNPC